MAERKESNGVTTEPELEAAIEEDANLEFTKPSTFRASIMQVLATGDLGDKFGIALVAKVKGDASDVWANVDKAKSNQLEFEEVRSMLINKLGFSPEQCTDDEVMAMVRAVVCSRCSGLPSYLPCPPFLVERITSVVARLELLR